MPGACYIEMAFESVLMGTKIEPLVIRDIRFHTTLPLNEESIRRIKCAKVKPDELRITLLAEHGEVVLSTAKLGEYRKTQNGNYLTLTEACKYFPIFWWVIFVWRCSCLQRHAKASTRDFIFDDPKFEIELHTL